LKSQKAKSQSIVLKQKSEFHLEDDDFFKSRHKGVRIWILKHIVYKSNKIFITLFFIFIVLTSFFGSILYVVIGKAIDIFRISTPANSHLVVDYTLLVLLIGLGSPISGLLGRTFREIVAQRIE